MVKIKALKVVSASLPSSFEDSLIEQINNMQRKGLTVTINNPHLTHSPDNYMDARFTAVIEGRSEVEESRKFPFFNIKS